MSLEGIFQYQINFDTQLIGKFVFQSNKFQQAGRPGECNQDIQITFAVLFFSRVRAKHFQCGNVISLHKRWKLLVEDFHVFLQLAWSCHNSNISRCSALTRLRFLRFLQVNFLVFCLHWAAGTRVQESSSLRVKKVYDVFLCVPS